MIPVAVVLLAVLGPTVLGQAAQSPKPHVPDYGQLVTVNGVRVLRLRGEPRMRGYAHGYLLAEEILSFKDALPSPLLPSVDQYQAMAPLVTQLFTFTEEEEAELSGMLAGITDRVGSEGIFLDQLGRNLELVDLKAINVLGDVYGLFCSSFSAWGELTEDGEPVVGRNFDFRALPQLVKYPLVQAVTQADGRRWIGVSFPGVLGVTLGLNDRGVCLAIHDVHVLPQDLFGKPRTPRLLALRGLLETLQGDDPPEQAVEFLRQRPTLYGNLFHLVLPRRKGAKGFVLEYDSRTEIDGGVTLRAPESSCYILNSNHYRQRDVPIDCPRYAAIQQELRRAVEQGQKIGFAEALRIIRAGSVPQKEEVIPENGLCTMYQAVVFPARGEIYLSFMEPGRSANFVAPKKLDFEGLFRG